MITPIVFDCIYEYDLEDWKTKKKKIETLLDGTYNRHDFPINRFSTDRGSKRTYLNSVMEILSPELQQFGTELSAKQIDIPDMWSVIYNKGDYHTPHTHGNINYSACLYLDFNDEHTGTHFITNPLHSATQSTMLMSSNAKEGRICFFPASMIHFTTPNESDVPRKVISFDIKI